MPTFRRLAGMEGLEPPQHRLTVYRSTNWTTLPYKGDLSIIAWHVLLMTKAPFGRGQTPKLPLRWCLGGVSKSRPLRYQHSALPLSYPGICAAVYIYEKLSAKTSPNLIRIVVPIAGLEPARPFGQQIFFTTLCYHSHWIIVLSKDYADSHYYHMGLYSIY